MNRPEGRWYAPIIGSSSILVTCTGVVLLLIMLRVWIGPFSLVTSPVGAIQSPKGVTIWEPESGRSRPSIERERRFNAWKALLPDSVVVHVTRDLAAAPVRGRELVIVSDAARLTDDESQVLLDHLRAGGSALLTGWIGVPEGERGTRTRMRRLLDVESIEALPKEASYFVAAAKRGPLVAGLLPSERLGLGIDSVVPAIDHGEAELVWTDWSLRSGGEMVGASRRRSVGRGRLVWLAPVPESAIGDAGTRNHLRQVIAGAIAWMGWQPYAELLAWPRAAPFAGLFAIDSEDQFQNARRVAAAAEQHDLPITFMVLSGVAKQSPEVLAGLARLGEIGSHADVHDGFETVSYEQQRQRLARSRDDLRALGIDEIHGFRPPYESYDDATERALAALGFVYVLGDDVRHAMVPRIVSPDGTGSRLVMIPRAVADDYELIVTRKIEQTADLEKQMRKDLERVERRGGLYYFSFHTQFFGTSERIALLTRMGELLRKEHAWLVTGRELADWWRRRAGCLVGVKAAGRHRLRIRVTNQGDQVLHGAAVRIHMNVPTLQAEVSGTGFFQARPELYLEPGSERLDLVLPDLAPGKNYAYDLDFQTDPRP